MTANDDAQAAGTWVTTTLGCLGQLHCGQSLPPSALNVDGRGVPYVSGPEQWNGHEVQLSKWTTSPARTAPAESIFITVKGAGVGKLFPGIGAAIGRDIYAFEPHPEIDFRFVYRALQFSIQDVVARARGDIPGLSKQHIIDHAIGIPGSNTQKVVASKIDELFSRIAEGEQALKRVAKLVERYRQSMLKAAVTGELTRDWREARKHAGGPVESGEALLARILKARRTAWEVAELARLKAKGKRPTDDRWKQKYKEPQAPDIASAPELPEGWVWTTLEQLCFVDTGATPKRGNARYYHGGTIDWITSAAVNEPLITSAAERITTAAIEETNAKVFPAGSLIVAMYGEGKTRGKVSELGISAATNQACAAVLCSHIDTCLKEYLRLFLEKNYLRLRGAAAGGVQPNLNLSIIKSLLVALPPWTEQAVIVSRAHEATTSSRVADDSCKREIRRSAALRQSILKAAFSGQLVPQSPNDEPASKLLEHIAVGRAGAAPVTRNRKKKVA